jgi:hypothetical protein
MKRVSRAGKRYRLDRCRMAEAVTEHVRGKKPASHQPTRRRREQCRNVLQHEQRQQRVILAFEL